ncbi:MAG: CRISPR-associated endonuclease Cas2 [Anaerolineales bacterium]|nr:CRISPR-associated endonuclease Cas2 [Anaerolineales bacterium]
MRIVVSYDISDDKRRRKVAEIMEGHGYRVQYSVLECALSKKKLAALKKRLQPLVKAKEMDSIRFYPLPADAVKQIQVMGNDMARTLGIIAIV